MNRYEGSGGGWRPDPLLDPPEGGVALNEGMSQPLWIGLNVPLNAPAGLYTGQIDVVVSVNEETPPTVCYELYGPECFGQLLMLLVADNSCLFDCVEYHGAYN